ncbi:MAG: hypothetical protein IH934_07805 [Nanoarchaeota archaeon]|nr:hypothetical protein [Nanoarchaeota archaeon]
MKKRLNKKAYFFLIDSILALGVLAVGAFLIFTSYLSVPSKEEPEILSDNVMDFFANNKIKDINNPYAGLGGTLWQTEGQPGGICEGEELIANAETTLLQQIGEFYEKSSGNICYLELAEKFIAELTQNSLPPQYLSEFWVNDTLLYPQNPTQEHIDLKNASGILIPSKKIVYGFLNQETGDLFGPYETEVIVWQNT